MDEHEARGATDFERLRASKHYAFVDALTVEAVVAEKIFFPPMPVDDVDRTMSRPVPPERAGWRRGFEQAQREAKTDE